MKKRRIFKRATSILLSGIMMLSAGCGEISTPTQPASPTPQPTPTPETALFVSLDGNDSNLGTNDAPFKTVEKAVDAVRALVAEGLKERVTVYIHAGDYNISAIKLTSADSGTAQFPVTYKAYGDGEVVFNGGRTLKSDKFQKVTDESVLSRFNEQVKDKIVVLDLKSEGLTLDMIGGMYAIGQYCTANLYNDGTVGSSCELFWNDTRLTIARYPNSDYVGIKSIADPGNMVNGDGLTYKQVLAGELDLASVNNGKLEVTDDVRERMKLWKSHDDIWIFGYFYYGWADQSTPLKSIDAENGIIEQKHFSFYGYNQEDCKFYIYNVLEEIDSPGEYYIDRDNMLLYVYPPENTETSEAFMSVSNDPIISGNADHISFEGISFMGARNDAINASGNNFTVKNCKITNCGGNGVVLDGTNNLVYGCEIAHMGKGGVILNGGDRNTLTPGNNIIENCYIHNYQELFKTYQYGAYVSGCGNIIRHNEVSDVPHCGIGYTGNNHTLEYNYIHDVCLDTNDAGAIYTGRDFSSGGGKVMYNLIENVGSDDTFTMGIYYDDGMSYATISGNILVNCHGVSLYLGGGRALNVENNLVIGECIPLNYDNRNVLYGHGDPGITDNMMQIKAKLEAVPYMSDIWREAYPHLADITFDISRRDEIDFAGNPSYSSIKRNVFVGPLALQKDWTVCEESRTYSTFGANYSYAHASVNPIEDGTYRLKADYAERINWTQLPYEEMGRYK